MPSKRTTIYLDDPDRQALSVLQAHYGLATLSDAIRFALRSMATKPQNGKVPQEPPLLDFRLNGSASLPYSPALVGPVSQPVGRAPAAGAAPQEEEALILVEKLQGTQEELSLVQDELARTQEELGHTTAELQALNQTLLEMSVDRESRAPADPQKGPTQRATAETSALALVSKPQVDFLLRQSASLREEHQRLCRQARTESARRRKARAA